MLGSYGATKIVHWANTSPAGSLSDSEKLLPPNDEPSIPLCLASNNEEALASKDDMNPSRSLFRRIENVVLGLVFFFYVCQMGVLVALAAAVAQLGDKYR